MYHHGRHVNSFIENVENEKIKHREGIVQNGCYATFIGRTKQN